MTTLLFQASVAGGPIDKVEVVLAKGSMRTVYRFRDVLVTSVQPSGNGHGDATPLDTFTFSGIFEGVSQPE